MKTEALFRDLIRRAAAALLAVMMTFTAQTAWAWDGNGTSDSPYLIKTTDDLVALATNSQSYTYDDKYFRLENDLNMKDVAIEPIGTYSKNFQAKCQGNIHT